jgi:DNA-binding IclR family transcriptional regulator
MTLTPRDLLILRAVYRHRLLRSTHLIALADGSRQTTLRRLQLLFHHGYLDRPPMQLDWYVRGSEPLA